MPEAAVNKNDCLVFGEHYVGLAGKVSAVNTETKTEAVQRGANAYLRSGIFPSDAAHVPRAMLFCESVFRPASR